MRESRTHVVLRDPMAVLTFRAAGAAATTGLWLLVGLLVGVLGYLLGTWAALGCARLLRLVAGA